MYFVFLTTCLCTTSPNFVKCTRIVFNLPISKSCPFAFKLFKPVAKLTNLLMSSYSTSAFKAAKPLLVDKVDVSIPVACSNYS